jgi:hypothetical protein
VSESAYATTFFKEGLATFGQVLQRGREAATRAVRAGKEPASAFDKAMVAWFDRIYSFGGPFWTSAPSDPHPYDLFSGSATYLRPGAAYVALWQILGRSRFTAALQAIQRIYGGSSITEAQLERQFGRFLPRRTQPCEQRLRHFFTEWFDTPYRSGGRSQRPRLTGPGLDGDGFYGGGCPRPRLN